MWAAGQGGVDGIKCSPKTKNAVLVQILENMFAKVNLV